MDSSNIINAAKDKIKAKIGKTILNPINELVDQNLTDVTTTIGSFIIRSVRGKFQRSITFNIGLNYADRWMEEALYGILYDYNNIKEGSRLEITNKAGLYDGTGMYYRLDDGTHNLKYRNWNILLAIQTATQAATPGRIQVQRVYTIITYDLSPEFVTLFEKDMLSHRNSLLKIRSDSPTINVFQDYHESDGYTYWEKSSTINKRRLATIYLPLETKQKIVNTVNEFFGNKEYYKRHGIAHNLKILLYGPPGPQPLDVMIPTPNGKVAMGDLNPGDLVLNLYGRPTDIEDIREYDDLDEYEIFFDDGRSTRCADTHIWAIINKVDNKLVKMTTLELISMATVRNSCYEFTENVPKVPIMFGAQYEYKPVELDPWVVGVLIAGGMFVNDEHLLSKDYLTISTTDEKIYDELCRITGWSWIGNTELTPYRLFFDKNHVPITLDYLFRKYTDLVGCIDDADEPREFILFPKNYVLNSHGVRWIMIQGVMDVRGTVNHSTVAGYDNGKFREERVKKIYVNLLSKQLTPEFLSILRSVGVHARIDTGCGSEYEIQVSLPKERDNFKFFYVSEYRYEMERYSLMKFTNTKYKDEPDGLGIVRIVKTGKKCKMRCLHVSDDAHIYLTDDFIPTHNTGKDSIAKMIASEWNRNIYYVTGGKEGRYIPNAITDVDETVNHPLLLISDIDKYPYLINEPEIKMDDDSAKEDRMKYKQLFGNMINALDGVLSAEGRIIIMTTNHIEKFSDTFTRPGRIDLKLEIGYVTPEVFRKYTYDFYGVELPDDIKLNSDKLTIAAMQFDVVFLKLSADEFIAKHLESKKIEEKKEKPKKENKNGTQ